MYENDTSIQTVLEIMKENPQNREYLKHAGEVFNSISGSDRNIIPDFYDCGTTARAIFMSLINNYRGNITFSKAEKAHLKKYTEEEGGIDDAIQTLEDMDNGVMICSLVIHNLGNKNYQSELGHVWIIEKKDDNYRLYQSALNNYTTIDHMVKYGINIDGPQFLLNMKPLLGKRKWSTSENSYSALFCRLFHYLPTIPLDQIDSVFHWTSIEY